MQYFIWNWTQKVPINKLCEVLIQTEGFYNYLRNYLGYNYINLKYLYFMHNIHTSQLVL